MNLNDYLLLKMNLESFRGKFLKMQDWISNMGMTRIHKAAARWEPAYQNWRQIQLNSDVRKKYCFPNCEIRHLTIYSWKEREFVIDYMKFDVMWMDDVIASVDLKPESGGSPYVINYIEDFKKQYIFFSLNKLPF